MAHEKAHRHIAASDPRIAQLIKRSIRYKITPGKAVRPFDALAESIAYQQLNGKAATTIWGRVRALYPKKKHLDPKLILKTPGLKQDLTLAPLQNKLQWNFKKNAARQPEPDERKAYKKLAAKKKKAKGEDFQVEITGPLRQTDQGLVLEVREFFLISSEAKTRGQD